MKIPRKLVVTLLISTHDVKSNVGILRFFSFLTTVCDNFSFRSKPLTIPPPLKLYEPLFCLLKFFTLGVPLFLYQDTISVPGNFFIPR